MYGDDLKPQQLWGYLKPSIINCEISNRFIKYTNITKVNYLTIEFMISHVCIMLLIVSTDPDSL